jgi:hypothetical protein
MMERTLEACVIALWHLLLGIVLLAVTADAAAADAKAPLVVFTTDFGTRDDAVGICEGVIKTISPDAEIIGLTREVTAYSIAEGARLLARTSQYYPSGTILLTVIDPGVSIAIDRAISLRHIVLHRRSH